MIRGVVLAVLLSVLIAVTQADPGCCAPNQWQGYAIGTSHTLQEEISEYVYFDFVNQRQRVDYVTAFSNSSPLLKSFLYRHDLDLVYSIDWVQQACTYTNLTVPIRQTCVPDGGDAFNFTLGIDLECTSYYFQFGSNVNDFVVSQPNCIPISGFFLAEINSEYLEWNWAFYNILDYINDPFVFVTPTGCTYLPPPPPPPVSA